MMNHAEPARIVSELGVGERLSAEKLARRLELPEQSVSSAIDWMRSIGLPIARVSDGAFVLERMIQPLNETAIREALSKHDRMLAARMHLFAAIDSTNEFLMQHSGNGSIHKRTCIAEHMTAGRGRRGRVWEGGAFQNLMLSMAWDLTGSSVKVSGLSLAVAVMVVQCMGRLHGGEFEVKWPNDVLWRGRKLSGILIELRGSVAVIGIGVNCDLTGQDLAPVARPAASLGEITGTDVDRTRLAAELIASLDAGMRRFEAEGFAGFRDAWTQLHAFSGRTARTDDRRPREGQIVGVDRDGALLLRTSGGEMVAICAGEISVVPGDA